MASRGPDSTLRAINSLSTTQTVQPRINQTIATPVTAAVKPALRNIDGGISAMLKTARFMASGNKA